MTNLVERLKNSVHKRAEFNRTYNELRDMPRATALDLGLFPEDAYKMAMHAVYG